MISAFEPKTVGSVKIMAYAVGTVITSPPSGLQDGSGVVKPGAPTPGAPAAAAAGAR